MSVNISNVFRRPIRKSSIAAHGRKLRRALGPGLSPELQRRCYNQRVPKPDVRFVFETEPAEIPSEVRVLELKSKSRMRPTGMAVEEQKTGSVIKLMRRSATSMLALEQLGIQKSKSCGRCAKLRRARK